MRMVHYKHPMNVFFCVFPMHIVLLIWSSLQKISPPPFFFSYCLSRWCTISPPQYNFPFPPTHPVFNVQPSRLLPLGTAKKISILKYKNPSLTVYLWMHDQTTPGVDRRHHSFASNNRPQKKKPSYCHSMGFNPAAVLAVVCSQWRRAGPTVSVSVISCPPLW